MSLYSEYLACEGYEILEVPEVGFCTFTMVIPECYIRDIYVRPEWRQKNVAAQLADAVADIAKSRGCRILIGSVSKQYKHAETSRKVLIGYGMKLGKEDMTTELFFKEI